MVNPAQCGISNLQNFSFQRCPGRANIPVCNGNPVDSFILLQWSTFLELVKLNFFHDCVYKNKNYVIN